MNDVEEILEAKTPSAASWSPDGDRLAFQVTGPKGSEIHCFSFSGKASTCLVTEIPPCRYFGEKPDLRWSPDGNRIVFCKGRDYFSIAATGGPPRLLASGSLLGALVSLSPNQQVVSFVRDGELWLQSITGTAPTRLTRGEEFPDHSEMHLRARLYQWPQWSPTGEYIAYVSPMRAGVKVHVLSIKTREVCQVVPTEDIWPYTTLTWAPNGKLLAISRLSDDLTRKELVVWNASDGTVQPVWSDMNDRWVTHPLDMSFSVTWADDCRRIAFLSNRDGWKHLYVADVHAGVADRLTEGDFEVYWCSWQPGCDSIVIVSSEGNLQQRLLWRVPVKGGGPRKLLDWVGICAHVARSESQSLVPEFEPNSNRIAFWFSSPCSPAGLWVVDSEHPECAVEVAPPAMTWKQGHDLSVEAVSFESADGVTIPAVLIQASSEKAAQSRPALVYAYGGWAQMATLGWTLGVKSFLLHYLAQKGYVILIVDPRGSEGYGADFAKSLYREGGGKQVDDLVAGAGYLQRLRYVDPKRIAIYGHSYGAYLALQTLVESPQTFSAGVIQAGVFDWEKDIGPAYTRFIEVRFGSPDETPNLVRQRSPIHFIDKLRAPLLILHGSGDYNVPIAASERLVSKLLVADKTFEYMAYPDEMHYWVRPETTRDFIKRVEIFLDRHLCEN